ncbi:MAG: biotin/lipoyl-binding protein, partial [Sphingomonas sp.]|nr:biotin/lipoyl-binding protein [Sphingomonas sp.]
DENFGAGRVDTGFIERNLDELVPGDEPGETLWRAAAAVALAGEEEGEAGQLLAGFRLNGPPGLGVALGRGGEFRLVDLGQAGPVAEVAGFRDDERVVLFDEGQAHEFSLASRGTVGAAAGDGAILAPMPGKVTSVDVSTGQKVVKGQKLLTLEAMKMEHGLVAPFDGIVAELNSKAGAQVQVDALLALIEPAGAPS